MLTTAAVKAARPRARAFKIADERGLHLFVAPTGTRSFRLRFRYRGHEQLLTIGQWPEVTLADARVRAEMARDQLARGVDPRQVPRAVTFEAAARAWHAHRKTGWTDVHADDVLVSLERHVFAAIGADPLGEIDKPTVLAAMRAIEARGTVETARRVLQRVADVFAYARSEGWTDARPTDDVVEAMKRAPAVKRQPALATIEDARALLATVDTGAGAAAVKLAGRFLALTGVRLAAVRGARWCEIEELDGPAPLWRVPAARVKLPAAKKLDPANDHLVPLSPAAVAVLQEAMALSPAAGIPAVHIFPGRGDAAPIAEGAIGALYDAAGYAGRHVPHGWRATFSTVMNDRFPDQSAIVERVLGHAIKGDDGKVDKVKAAYDRSQVLEPRRRLLDAWAAMLFPSTSRHTGG